jgi:hypothetical protein
MAFLFKCQVKFVQSKFIALLIKKILAGFLVDLCYPSISTK